MSQESNPKNSIDLSAARAKSTQDGGKHMWQSLEQLSDTQEFRNFTENEFPANAENEFHGINRRDALKLMAASTAMAGLSACTKLPTEKIVPYVHPPEEIIPGKPLFYATSFVQNGVATGLLVESHMGRPTKIEGNPEHPGSLGGTDVFAQASVLNMYDPDRSQVVIFEGHVSTWGSFVAAMKNARTELSPKGTGMRILTETVTSPTLAV
jgi:molybdopterin-containing oxidoreductase family iron-sulfur binding subunit